MSSKAISGVEEGTKSSLKREYKINEKNEATKFHVACAVGNLQEVKFCVENGFDLNLKISQRKITDSVNMDFRFSQWTGFNFACFEGHEKIVKFLLLETDFKILEKADAFKAIKFATGSQNVDLVKFLLNHVEKMKKCDLIECFLDACEMCDVPMAKYFLTHHKNIHAGSRGEFGSNGLHWACCSKSSENLSMVKFLIQQGCKIHSRDGEKKTAFHISCECGNLNLVQFLAQNGMNFNHTDREQGKTGFHFACEGGELNVVEWLVSQGMDLVRRDDFEEIGFHKACAKARLNIIHFLITQSHEQMEVENFQGHTGLDILISLLDDTDRDYASCILFLIESGAQSDNLFQSQKLIKLSKNRLHEITFVGEKLFKTFNGRIAQTIFDFTTQPILEFSEERLRQAIQILT